jgi:hypothetical protein
MLPRLMFRASACFAIGNRVRTIDHRLALSSPALLSASSKNRSPTLVEGGPADVFGPDGGRPLNVRDRVGRHHH